MRSRRTTTSLDSWRVVADDLTSTVDRGAAALVVDRPELARISDSEDLPLVRRWRQRRARRRSNRWLRRARRRRVRRVPGARAHSAGRPPGRPDRRGAGASASGRPRARRGRSRTKSRASACTVVTGKPAARTISASRSGAALSSATISTPRGREVERHASGPRADVEHPAVGVVSERAPQRQVLAVPAALEVVPDGVEIHP